MPNRYNLEASGNIYLTSKRSSDVLSYETDLFLEGITAGYYSGFGIESFWNGFYVSFYVLVTTGNYFVLIFAVG